MDLKDRINHIQKELDSVKRDYAPYLSNKYIIISGLVNSTFPLIFAPCVSLFRTNARCPEDLIDDSHSYANNLQLVSIGCKSTKHLIHDDMHNYLKCDTSYWGNVIFTKNQVNCIYKCLDTFQPYGNVLAKQAKIGTKLFSPKLLKYIDSYNN